MSVPGTVAADAPVSISWCPVERVPALQALIDEHWRRGHILARDRELLEWQFRDTADPARLTVLLAEYEGTPVGMLGVIPCGFCVRGQRVSGLWLAMWLTTPEWRARRLGLRLLQRLFVAQNDVIASVGVNVETAGGIYRALGFSLCELIPRWIRVISPEPLDSLLADLWDKYPAGVRQQWLATARREDAGPASSVRLLSWDEELAGRWDEVWQRDFAPRLIGTWRDAAYLRWRYVDHPRYRYELRFAEDPATGALAGLTVYRIETVRDRSERVLRVVEFLCGESVAASLARAVVEAAEATGVAFADFFCASPVFAAGLEAAGFVREESLPAALPSRFQPLDAARTRLNGVFWAQPAITGDQAAFFQTADLYVTRADGDQDRPS
jgi:hypothetical protein